MNKALIVIVFLIIGSTSLALPQSMDSVEVKDYPFYYTLESALKEPEKVYRLRLQNKKLDSIPKEIFQFKNLRQLDLSKNKIKEVPPEIGNLKQLEILDLSKNEIEVFTKEICFLPNVTILRMSRNNLVNIPAEIENLQKLEVLDLWDNDLAGFPESLSKLESLKSFDLRGILIDIKDQRRIEEMLPNVKIHFSPSCNCGF